MGTTFAKPAGLSRCHLFALMEGLDHEVAMRSHKQLDDESDRDKVSSIAVNLKNLLQLCGLSFEGVYMDKVPGVMTRVHLFSGQAVEVRLHLFQDPTETCVHNHRSSFFSCCLRGSYLHRIWTVHPSQCNVHYVFNRTKDPGGKELWKQQGSVELAVSHSFQEGGVYYIAATTSHTVKRGSKWEGPVLTLYIKGKNPVQDTLVLMPEPMSFCPEQGQDVALEPEERRSFSQALQRMFA